ncbi:dTDP-4-dehydrorhamnose 3,5-epimerase [Alishewanella longhuensis]|uniref:dTDP-4-dehydrorhamnose 3,5-epimerase n=1 Tax=Alishewanella longhuensis TaxID=1091037 RepID=A0ABQ3KXX6_9ALTE|nr:dTDP-4-dehydrorhamnose 3,5-epimerase family protein [Alishewanella longhuensis]GHG69285.1 dTDP-4-dehydrorhamnose 3,5-epimerase [Alishewanella longhuensis]
MDKLSRQSTKLAGVELITSLRHSDSRGSFSRWFCQQELASLLPRQQIVQINHSISSKQGTVRGMHFQYPPYAEYKLVRCIVGRVFDVVIDLRAGSASFMQHISVELSPEQNTMLLIPPGCAHGFQSLTDNAELLYLHSAFYTPDAEGGLRFDDPALKIDWPLPISCVSERDAQLPLLNQHFSGLKL